MSVLKSVRSTLLVLASFLSLSSSLARAEVPAVPDSMEQRMLVCAACHGRSGEGLARSDYYPRIAGKPAGYLFRQLADFRSGRRPNGPMRHLLRHLSDDYLREIARYYASLHPPFPLPAIPALRAADLEHAARLVHEGDAGRRIPACTACHGDALTGAEPAVPGIVGLFPTYVTAQLSAWKNKVRRAAEPDCMARIAQRLEGTEISALGAWLGAQSVSSTTPAAPVLPAHPPLECGSFAVQGGSR